MAFLFWEHPRGRCYKFEGGFSVPPSTFFCYFDHIRCGLVLKVLLHYAKIYFMKIIHTADIHLGSPLVGVADPSMRRMELVSALQRLSDYADRGGVAAVIVAGDLFDDKFASAHTVASVADIIQHSRASWFVLRGNHGGAEPYALLHKLCPQVCFFGDDWTCYSLQNVTLCGRELGNDDREHWQTLQLDPRRYNIVVLHGDVDDPTYGFVDKNALASSNAAYVALGHRHAFAEMKFGNVRACYSGVPEPRGFDERAPTGFVEIDTDSDKIRFVKQSLRTVEAKRLDVSNITSDVALERALTEAVRGVNPGSYLDFVFCGVCGDLHPMLVAKRTLSGQFFALRVRDETRPAVDIAALNGEVSLKSEFVKLAMSTISDEQMLNDVLKLGLAALNGEELQ